MVRERGRAGRTSKGSIRPDITTTTTANVDPATLSLTAAPPSTEVVKGSSRRLVDRWTNSEPADPDERYEKLFSRGSKGGRGKCFRLVRDGGYAEKVARRELTHKDVEEEIGFSTASISYAMNLLRADAILDYLNSMDDEQGGGKGGKSGWVDIYSMTDFQLEDVVEYFVSWRAKHFLTPQRTPYVTTPFHRRWIVAILKTIRDGRNLLILSPPRHGKTELMIHFDIFFITRVNPDISIVRVCKSEGLAKKVLSSEMDHLEHNEELVLDSVRDGVLPRGRVYQPPHRGGKPWNASEFTVATRTITGLKSPTCAAVGAGGTLLSRDGDVFVIDDIEDAQTVYTSDMREKRRTWFSSDLMSRKVDGNAFVYIGSRQHPDDIPGHLIDNPEWEVIVESAHDEVKCEVVDPDSPDNWPLHTSCVLWPEMRSYSWLMSIKNDPERAPTYPMIYLNEPTDEEVDVFSRGVLEMAKDGGRITHPDPSHFKYNYPEPFYDNEGIYHPIRLIAGLDPSGSGYQASFLWAVDVASFRLYMVDYENRLGGGLHRARDVIERWRAQYGLQHWVIESNLYHNAFMKDDMMRALAAMDNITLTPHETGTNKWDQTMGVGVLAKMMENNQISMPWGNVQTQAKWKLVTSQYINFSRDSRRGRSGRSRVTKTDIVMASWFPLATMQRWRRDWIRNLAQEKNEVNSPFTPMADIYSSIYSSIPSYTR